MQEQFQIPIIFDLGATFVFGVTGALAALRRGYDVVGLFALAFASGVGGGLLRDGLLTLITGHDTVDTHSTLQGPLTSTVYCFRRHY